MKNELLVLNDLIATHKQLPVILEMGFDHLATTINKNNRSFNCMDALTVEIAGAIDELLDMLDNDRLSNEEFEFFKPLYNYWTGDDIVVYIEDRKKERESD